MQDTPSRERLDLLRGLSEIASYLGASRRVTQYLHATGRIPTFSVGKVVCARKVELDEALRSRPNSAG